MSPQKQTRRITEVDAEATTAVKRVPDVTIERLAIYSRVLWELEREGRDTVSSRTLAEHTPYGAAQIRRDFAWFGQFGTRGKGYRIPSGLSLLDHDSIYHQLSPISQHLLGRLNILQTVSSNQKSDFT